MGDKLYDNPDTVVLSEFRIIYGSDRLRLWATLIAGLFGCNNMGVVESNLGAGVVLTSQAPHWTPWRANGGPAQKLLCHKACRGRNPANMIIQSSYYQTRQRPIWNVHYSVNVVLFFAFFPPIITTSNQFFVNLLIYSEILNSVHTCIDLNRNLLWWACL